jgi:putative transposase
MVTAGTYGKRPFFNSEERLSLLEDMLLRLAHEHGWTLEAWAVFANHYHFIGCSSTPNTVRAMTRRLHASSAGFVNARDGARGRKVWHNYWETHLTYEKSYLARLGYVHQNAVHHGIVEQAAAYRWCSAGWFERTATAAQIGTVYGFRIDRVSVPDDFVVIDGV